MDLLLGLSYVVHVASALFWVGAVLQVTYSLVPFEGARRLTDAGAALTLDKLLRVTRWTGLTLPVTGLYQVWALYPLDRLLTTPRGHLVLAMFALWGVMNGVVELGVYRARTVEGARPPTGRYLLEGVRADGGIPEGTGTRALRVARPYLVAASLLGVLLAVDAALLAGGLAALR